MQAISRAEGGQLQAPVGWPVGIDLLVYQGHVQSCIHRSGYGIPLFATLANSASIEMGVRRKSIDTRPCLTLTIAYSAQGGRRMGPPGTGCSKGNPTLPGFTITISR